MRPIRNQAGALAVARGGTAVLEFALVAPLFLTMLFGVAGYGGYFWRAHAIQQAANDAARAAIPGLTAGERQSLALGAIAGEMQLLGIDPGRAVGRVDEAGDMLTVSIAYDGTRDGVLALGIVPLPSRVIRRIGAVRLGGL